MAKKVASKKAEVHEQQAAVAAVSELKVQEAVQDIATLQITLQQTLADLGSKITGKLAQVEQIDLAIATKMQQLEDLYAIEKEAANLEEIKALREQESLGFAQDAKDRNQQLSDERVALQKQRDREAEEYNYAIKVRNERAQQEFQSLIDSHKRDEAIRQAELTRGWMAREEAIKTQESEITNLRALVASFDSKIKAEVDKAVAIVSSQIKKAHEQELAMLKKDMEVAEKLHQSLITSKDTTIASLSKQIDTLNTQLAQAQQDSKDVIAKTLEAASKSEAYNALKGAWDASNQSGKGK